MIKQFFLFDEYRHRAHYKKKSYTVPISDYFFPIVNGPINLFDTHGVYVACSSMITLVAGIERYIIICTAYVQDNVLNARPY